MSNSAIPLGIGVGGLVLGVLSLVTGEPALGLVAGCCALAVAGLTVRSGTRSGAPSSGIGAPTASGSYIGAHLPSTGASPVRADTESASSQAGTGTHTPWTKPVDIDLGEPTIVRPKSERPPEDRSRSTPPASQPIEMSKSRPGETGGAALMVDPESGLHSEAYFEVTLEARVASARRHLRPVACVLFEVLQETPEGRVPVSPEIVAEAVRSTLREADTACRYAGGIYALILEDTPEDGAVWSVERVRKALTDSDGQRRVRAGVACYPVHGVDAESLRERSDEALRAARDWPQDRIEVAPNLG